MSDPGAGSQRRAGLQTQARESAAKLLGLALAPRICHSPMSKPKKLKRTILSPIIVLMSNVSHGKNNLTPNCMLNKFP